MKLKLGDMVRAPKASGAPSRVLMTICKLLSNGHVVCCWFAGPRMVRVKLRIDQLVKEPPLISFTVEVCLPSRSWKRNRVKTHITTAYSEHEARRNVLQMYLRKGRQVLSTQVVDRYPKGV